MLSISTLPFPILRFATIVIACTTVVLFGVTTTILAADVSPEHAAYFENQVRPLLAERCFECHGEVDQSGDLRLDSLGEMLAGGETGPVIVPGDPDASFMIDAVEYESLEMPPDEPLSQAEIDILRQWIKIGAPWPGSHPNAPVRKREAFNEEDRKWWAIQPVSDGDIPKLSQAASADSDWVCNDIDHFILNSMASEGLRPAPSADALDLIRRVYFDVTGLPPTPQQIQEFVEDESAGAFERLVDRLLNSNAYGEHAARQWLDLVRYADSDGYRADGFRPDAWRYRDYVIKSFNDDKPYDRFVQEQIAGDELFPDDTDAQIALGYLRQWVYEWNIRDARTQWKTILDDVTDTTADAFLGLGLQCAKCHNHKFDPLLQKDYFRLQAFFAPIMPVDKVVADKQEIERHVDATRIWEAKTETIRKKIADLEKNYRDKYRNIAIDRFPDDLQTIARTSEPLRDPKGNQLAYLVQRQVDAEYDRLDSYIKGEDKEKLLELRRELEKHKTLKPNPLPIAMAVTDVGRQAPISVLPKRPDFAIEPGVPSIINPEPATVILPATGNTTGRRSAIAKWITSPNNPLSTRVIVNRIWQSHFGRGLASNTSDFGRLGGSPTHPELLDRLTRNFIDQGWSIKTLRRQILLSATYRQSTRHPDFDRQQQIDPGNRYYWRRNTRRLSAEQIRDALLLVTGKLKQRDGGPGVLSDSPYRSVYNRVMRNSPDELLSAFDLPQFFSSNSSRNTTTTPVQSLLMINSDRMLGHARRLATLVCRETSSPKDRVGVAWQRVFGRQPTQVELNSAIRFIAAQQNSLKETSKSTNEGLIETSKLPYRDGQSVKFSAKQPALRMSIPHREDLDVDAFTVETFFQLRSIATTGQVRTAVAKWDGDRRGPGWRFGVTGKGSRRKPQTLVLQMYGKNPEDKIVEAAVFSDQYVAINTPYYAAAVLTPGSKTTPGKVVFYLKDLSNDDEPLQIAEIPHSLVGGYNNNVPMTIGGVHGRNSQPFDGLVDDVRLVNASIDERDLLYTDERDLTETIGFWQFESDPGVLLNTAGEGLEITVAGDGVVSLSPEENAYADFTHALLNANEFLYVD